MRSSGGIKHLNSGGYEVYFKEDGVDYLALFKLLRAGGLAGVSVIKETDVRDVYLLEYAGRKYIFKRDRYVPKKLEARLRHLVRGSFYVRQIKSIGRAARRGCRVTPEFLLVALQAGRFYPRESFVLQEYVEGVMLESAGSPEQYKNEIIRAFTELHAYGLALGDVNTSNLMVSPDGIKIIDLTWSSFAWAGKGQDVVRLKHRLGITFPVTTPSLWLAVKYTSLKFLIRDALHNLRHPDKPRNSFR